MQLQLFKRNFFVHKLKYNTNSSKLNINVSIVKHILPFKIWRRMTFIFIIPSSLLKHICTYTIVNIATAVIQKEVLWTLICVCMYNTVLLFRSDFSSCFFHLIDRSKYQTQNFGTCKRTSIRFKMAPKIRNNQKLTE